MLNSRRYWIVIAVLIAAGAIRIASTYRIFADTADEGVHLSAGLEVLTEHRYGLQLQNPPLPRVVIAIPPWLAGARWDSAHRSFRQALSAFFILGDYKRMLVLARAGTLVFFVLAVLATAALARFAFGNDAAALAAFFVTTQPAILGHAGLATVDVAGTAGFAVALLAFWRWLSTPSWSNTLLLGLAYGFAINCKFLCIAYVPIACAAMYVVSLLRDEAVRRSWRLHARALSIPFVASFVVWVGYGFSIGPFLRGMRTVLAVNREGFPGYAFGQVSTSGWWWYFPVAFGLKTPISFLLLVVAAVCLPRCRPFVVAAAAVLALSMTTHVDIGIRYILPIYVPLSVAAAVATSALLTHRWRVVRYGVIAILLWYGAATTFAHPDYLAYFNELAGRDPSRYLVDSNLDWGQDVLRLRHALRERHVERVGLSVMSTDNFERLGFPSNYGVSAWQPASGWVAVSDHVYRMEKASGGWSWLEGQPYTRVGKSIRLYYLP